MSVKDVIKQSVLRQLGSGADLGIRTVIVLLAASILIGIYIYAVYKNQSKSAFYSKDLNITIAGLPVIVCVIMIAMQSNLIVSLGMVGALSIVRFRNAVKNPLDLLYFFWSISAGIVCGVGLIVLAVLLCASMTGLILLLTIIPNARASSLLVLRSSRDDIDWGDMLSIISKHGKHVREKSRSLRSGQTEVIYELVTIDEDNLISDIQNIGKFEQINLLTHDGELRI